MNALQKLEGLTIETVQFEPAPPHTLFIRGTLTMPEPTKKIQPYLERVHEAVLADGLVEYRVDVTGLTFVNSSAIRLFVDWVVRIEDSGKPYQLVFVTDRSMTWQRTAFKGIAALGGDCVQILS